MAFTLSDLGNDEHFLIINFWNWRVIVEIIHSFEIIEPKRLELLHNMCSGGKIEDQEASQIGDLIDKQVLPILPDGSRIKLDLTITDEPDDAEFHRGDDWPENYSCTKECLIEFSKFCSNCKGFCV